MLSDREKEGYALINAVGEGDEAWVVDRLTRRAVSFRDVHNQTALGYACISVQPNMGRLLVGAGAKLDPTHPYDKVALQHVAADWTGEMRTALGKLAGAVKAPPPVIRAVATRLLVVGIRRRDLVLVSEAIGRKARLDDSIESEVTGPLALAAGLGYEEIVDVMLRAGADPNGKLAHSSVLAHPPPLVAAASGGHLGTVHRLITSGADLNVHCPVELFDQPKETALVAAAEGGHVDVVRLLVDSAARFGVRLHALTHAATEAGRRGHREVAELLDPQGATTGAAEAARLADLRLRAASALMSFDVKDLEACLDLGFDVDQEDHGMPLLMLAIRCSNRLGVQALLRRGANPNYRLERFADEPKGSTALHLCASGNVEDLAIVVLLHDAGASLEARDANGSTPLDLAGRNTKMRDLLIALGATPGKGDRRRREADPDLLPKIRAAVFAEILPPPPLGFTLRQQIADLQSRQPRRPETKPVLQPKGSLTIADRTPAPPANQRELRVPSTAGDALCRRWRDCVAKGWDFREHPIDGVTLVESSPKKVAWRSLEATRMRLASEGTSVVRTSRPASEIAPSSDELKAVTAASGKSWLERRAMELADELADQAPILKRAVRYAGAKYPVAPPARIETAVLIYDGPAFHLPLLVGFGAGEDVPSPCELSAVLAHWSAKYRATLVAVTSTSLELIVEKPPESDRATLEAARELYLVCRGGDPEAQLDEVRSDRWILSWN